MTRKRTTTRKKVAKKKAARKRPARPKAITFNFARGEVRTETVKAAGFKPFDITFRVPGALEIADYQQGMAVKSLAGDDKSAWIGQSLVDFCARQIVSWTLEPEPTADNIGSLNDTEILYMIFVTISESGGKAKN